MKYVMSILLVLVISFLPMWALVFVASMIFDFTFKWIYVLFVWLICVVMRATFNFHNE